MPVVVSSGALSLVGIGRAIFGSSIRVRKYSYFLWGWRISGPARVSSVSQSSRPEITSKGSGRSVNFAISLCEREICSINYDEGGCSSLWVTGGYIFAKEELAPDSKRESIKFLLLNWRPSIALCLSWADSFSFLRFEGPRLLMVWWPVMDITS